VNAPFFVFFGGCRDGLPVLGDEVVVEFDGGEIPQPFLFFLLFLFMKLDEGLTIEGLLSPPFHHSAM